MSEQAGQILTNQWRKLEAALIKYAANNDWKNVEKVNDMLVTALSTHSQPTSAADLMARQSLEKTHKKVIERALNEKDQLAKMMKQLQDNKAGLAAYELTHLSGQHYD